MNYRMVTRHLEVEDGTRIAHHTHLGAEPDDTEAGLAARTPVLLTSGIGTTANFWRFLIDVLKEDHRVVHWDYRGHGQSDPAKHGDYAISTLVDDLIRVTEETISRGKSRRPPLHIGFSMGVAILLELYRRRPDLVPAMVLIAGSAQAPGTNLLAKVPGARRALRTVLKTLTPAVPVLAPAVHKLLASPLVYPAGRLTGVLRKRAPKKDIDYFMRELCRMEPLAFWQTLRGLMEVDATDVLSTVKVPVLIVAPENDLMMPPGQVEKLREALPHAEYLSVEDAGHAGLLEAGTEVSAAIHAFLHKVG